MLTRATIGTGLFLLLTLFTVFVQSRGVSPFALYHFVSLGRFYVSKDVAPLFVVGRRVTSRVTEMLRIYVMTTGFTRKVAVLVILGLHLPTLH